MSGRSSSTASALSPTPLRPPASHTSASFAAYLNPAGFIRHLWRYRDLIAQFTQREVGGRYRSSLLGIVWAFVTPLVLLVVYTFVFGVVLKARWADTATDRLSQFGLVLFAGTIAFGIFGECVGRAPGLIVSTPNYVKRVVFPLEVLPISVLGSALFHAGISLSVLLALHLILGGQIFWTWFWIPVVLLPVIFLSLGALWALASLGVFVRDLSYAVTLAVQVLFFLTPIFYPLDAIPEPYRQVVRLNPLAGVVESLRAVIFRGAAPQFGALLISGAAGILMMFVGYAWFMRTRRAFGDVI